MARLLIGMRLAMLRHQSGGWWGWKAWVGLVLAIGVLGIAGEAGTGSDELTSVAALVLLLWTLGMVLLSLQSGAGGADLLPEHFALLPIPPRRLAQGLLAAAFVSPGALILLVASLILPLMGLRLGATAALIAIPALVLHVLFVLLLIRVLLSVASMALRTKIGVEIVALQWALMISLLNVGWVLLGVPAASGGVGEWLGEMSDGFALLLRLLPTGWSAVAVGAAADGRWLLALGALIALAVAVALLLVAWSRILQRRLTTQPTSSSSGVRWTGRFETLRSPMQAAIWREVVRWMRDPRSAIEFRVALLTAVFVTCLPLAVGWYEQLSFTGAVLVVMAALTASNTYSLEGTSLWLTLMAPDSERTDVRGKQWAFLVLYGPLAVLATAVPVFITGMHWTWPWLLTFVPAGLGIAAGTMILISVHSPVPVPEAARRSGNLMDSGDAVGPAYLTLLLVLLLSIPGLAVTGFGVLESSVPLQVLGVLLGSGIGVLTFWLCGERAITKLQAEGPEILTLLRHPPSATASIDEEDEPRVPRLVQARITILWILGMLSIFPQALVPAVFKLTGQDETVWFLPLFLPDVWQWPAILGMLAFGGLCVAAAVRIMRRAEDA